MRVALSSSRHRERLPFSFEMPGNIANDTTTFKIMIINNAIYHDRHSSVIHK